MKTSPLFRACASAAFFLLAYAGTLANAQSNAALDRVLNQMDSAEKNFRSTQATFVWDEYQSVVKSTETQKGQIYFRRAGNETQMAVDITDPSPKYVLLSGTKMQVFEPRIDRVTVYDVAKNHGEFEALLVLGFGGGGHTMLKSFDVNYLGSETLGGVETSKLDLTPKSEKIRGMFPHIVLWIDPARGISVQQQLFQGGGDYRLARYSNFQLNQKIPDAAFKLKTGGKTTIESVSP